ncbi:MAG: hypothetical protein EOP67_32735, partial [Sphingomonas sp.]
MHTFRALAALALLISTMAAAQTAEQLVPPAVPDAVTGPSAAAMRVVDWVAASGDNHALPYVIVDKTTASMLMFDAKGKALGT